MSVTGSSSFRGEVVFRWYESKKSVSYSRLTWLAGNPIPCALMDPCGMPNVACRRMGLPPPLVDSSGVCGVCFRKGGVGRGPGGAGRIGKAKLGCLPLLLEPAERLGLCRPRRRVGGGGIFGMEFVVIMRGPSPG